MLGFARLFHGMQAQLASAPQAEPGMTKRKCLQCLFHSIGQIETDAEFLRRAEEWARRQ